MSTGPASAVSVYMELEKTQSSLGFALLPPASLRSASAVAEAASEKAQSSLGYPPLACLRQRPIPLCGTGKNSKQFEFFPHKSVQ